MDRYSKNVNNGEIVYNLNGDDNRSISESISSRIRVKCELPSLSATYSRANARPKPENSIDDLLDKIDNMEQRFDQMSEVVDEIDERDMEIFQLNVQKWIDTDNAVAELEKRKRELVKMRNSYDSEIVLFMKKYRIDDLNIDGGEVIKYESKTSKTGFTQKRLNEQLHNYFIQNREMADTLMKYLEDNRQTVSKDKIKRVKGMETPSK